VTRYARRGDITDLFTTPTLGDSLYVSTAVFAVALAIKFAVRWRQERTLAITSVSGQRPVAGLSRVSPSQLTVRPKALARSGAVVPLPMYAVCPNWERSRLRL